MREKEIDKQFIREKLQTEVAKTKVRIAEMVGDQGKGHNPDRADLAQSYIWLEQDIALLRVAKKRLNRIEQALDRLEEESYGQCDGCGRRINFDRLQVLPTAELCIHCKEKQEQV